METIKLKSAEEIVYLLEAGIPYEITYERPYIIEAIQIAQRDSIEKTLQIASENAVADYNFTEYFDRLTGENIEVYVINSSILYCKETIFKENNL